MTKKGMKQLATTDKTEGRLTYFTRSKPSVYQTHYLSTKHVCLCVTGTYSLLTIQFDLTRRLGFHMIQVWTEMNFLSGEL